MRTVHWLFVVSVALFLSGIAMVIAAGRTAAPAAVAPDITTPVASVRQIMDGIVAPAARVVFESVATIVQASGTEERYPRTDQEWLAVGNSAAALVESGNLLMLGDRALDRGDWLTMSRAMMKAAEVAIEAIEAKDKEALLASGDAINQSCDKCHQKYQRQ